MENQNNGPKRADGRRDALLGVTRYLNRYYCVNWNVDQVNEFMKQYRISRGSNPSWRHSKNAQYVQRGFADFVAYCKANLKRKRKL